MLTITLTTDFGMQDAYVGVMKGVMANIAPDARFIDITHTIPPQDVSGAAYVLWTALPYFPPESVHLVVVDPGVGTARRPIAAQTPWGILVGPDNGVFSYVWDTAPPSLIVELQNPAYQAPMTSATFHGRDIFAPAAAHIAQGVPLSEFGASVMDPVYLPLPVVEISETRIRGEIIYIDHFGNAVSSIGRLIWDADMLHFDPAFGDNSAGVLHSSRTHVHVAGQDLGVIQHTYGACGAGEALALVGSTGMLEIAVNQGNGAAQLGLQIGDPVALVVDS